MNVLVYNGNGTTPGSVKHAVETLRHFLEPHYAVNTVNAKILKTEPWTSKTAALVFPGGADLPYVEECEPVIYDIKRFIERGGLYIGFCAGGYFGTSRVEFAQGDPLYEVVGDRKLKFFPGIARGPAFKGFKYNSEVGARAAKIKSANGINFETYFNGGPLFVDAAKYDTVKVLAEFTEPTSVSGFDTFEGENSAAVILATVGKGRALLTGPHPEFIPRILEKSKDSHLAPDILKRLKENEPYRSDFVRYILTEAGLKCNNAEITDEPPCLTPMFACSLLNKRHVLKQFKENLFQISSGANSSETKFTIEGESDEFDVYQGFDSNYKKAQSTLDDVDPQEATKVFMFPNDDEKFPQKDYVPTFDIEKYFDTLNPENEIGSILLYDEVVTSTSSLLNNNKKVLNAFPDNSVLHVGMVQVAGTGRGGNTWVNPVGVLASTAVISAPLVSPRTNRPVSIVFSQYLAILAYSKAILSYMPGFEDLPIRIKWPNDIYALSPEYYKNNKIPLVGKGVQTLAPLTDIEPAYLKISGLLVNTHFASQKFVALLGCGLNISVDGPTVSVDHLIDILNEERKQLGLESLPHISVEILLAKYMNNLDIIMKQFINYGVSALLPEYYKLWLHTNQVVTLTDHNNAKAVIVGITEDYGLLVAKELEPGSNSQFTGKTYHLQPDGNTFDIFRGLISKKV